MSICSYFVQFIFYSFLGWIYECIYCTVQNKSWQNRGFLYGPICPIYGAGATAALILMDYGVTFQSDTPLWQIFLICALGTAVMEYVTSFVLEKLFKARWWDYSDLPLNINGRVCLIVTGCFGVAGIVIVKFLLPFFSRFEGILPDLLVEVLALGFMAILASDLTVTVNSLMDLTGRLDQLEEEFNERAQETYEIIANGSQEVSAYIKSAKEYASALGNRQHYILRNIRKYSNENRSTVASELKEHVKEFRENHKKNESSY